MHSLGATEVYDTYEAGGNWVRKAFEETGEITLGAFGGSFAVAGVTIALGFVPGPGWVVLIGMAGAIGFQYAGKLIGNEIYDTSMNLYDYVSAI